MNGRSRVRSLWALLGGLALITAACTPANRPAPARPNQPAPSAPPPARGAATIADLRMAVDRTRQSVEQSDWPAAIRNTGELQRVWTRYQTSPMAPRGATGRGTTSSTPRITGRPTGTTGRGAQNGPGTQVKPISGADASAFQGAVAKLRADVNAKRKDAALRDIKTLDSMLRKYEQAPPAAPAGRTGRTNGRA